MTSFNLNYILKGPNSKYSHSGGYGFNEQILGGHSFLFTAGTLGRCKRGIGCSSSRPVTQEREQSGKGWGVLWGVRGRCSAQDKSPSGWASACVSLSPTPDTCCLPRFALQIANGFSISLSTPSSFWSPHLCSQLWPPIMPLLASYPLRSVSTKSACLFDPLALTSAASFSRKSRWLQGPTSLLLWHTHMPKHTPMPPAYASSAHLPHCILIASL